ncbi:hypothetical protein NB11A_08690 [Ligilactobacillus agilis]|nr:hypothetical protein NB11A_08690 [Ligilactobacillus agilis]
MAQVVKVGRQVVVNQRQKGQVLYQTTVRTVSLKVVQVVKARIQAVAKPNQKQEVNLVLKV